MDPNIPAQSIVQPEPQLVQAPTQPTNLPQSSSKKKWILISAVLLLLIVVSFGGAYFLSNKMKSTSVSKAGNNSLNGNATQTTKPTPTPDPTANWRTYTNTKYGYSIQYPENWFARESPDTMTGAAFTSSSKMNDYASETISIAYAPKPYNDVDINTPFAEYIKTAAIKQIQNYIKLSSINPITTNASFVGYETTWMVQSITGSGTSESLPITFFEIPKDNKAIIWVFLSKKEDLDTYNKMLSTFKFTDQASQIGTANWQSYQSGQNIDGISINYPGGWKVNYRKAYKLSFDYKASYRIAFDFAPSGWNSPQSVDWMGWGSMFFDVYDPQADINQWVTKYAPNSSKDIKLSVVSNVGGKPTFDLASTVSQFGGTVILGTSYSYFLSYSQNGYSSSDNKENFLTVLKAQIFPTISIN